MQLSERFTQLRSFIQSGLLICAALLSLNASALEQSAAKNVLDKLHLTQVHTYAALNAYYNFSTAQGDKSILIEIREATGNVDQYMNDLTPLLSSENEEKSSQIAKSWGDFKNLIETNIKDVLEQGYHDLRLVDDLSRLTTEFNADLTELYSSIKESSQVPTSKLIENSRKASILMSAMTTRYSARATSNVSQIFQGAASEKPLDELAKEFDQLLVTLSSNAGKQQPASELLDSISTKWNFIKDSYVNYNENNVNYVVNLYSRRIISSLEELGGIPQS